MDSQAAETLTFRCPACDTSLRVPVSLAGVSGPCPQCRVEITAPATTNLDPGQPDALIPDAGPAPRHGQQPDPVTDRLSNGPTSALQLQGHGVPSDLSAAEPEHSIIRSPASRDNDNIDHHAPLRSPGIEPVTDGVPLPSRQLAAKPRQASRPASSSSRKPAPAKRRISLHPLSFILIVLLSAGSGVAAMLMINPINHPPLTLPAAPALNPPGKTGIPPTSSDCPGGKLPACQAPNSTFPIAPCSRTDSPPAKNCGCNASGSSSFFASGSNIRAPPTSCPAGNRSGCRA